MSLIPKEAIELAIEGGWQVFLHPKTGNYVHNEDKHALPFALDWQEIALDPDFWRALGKVLEWDNPETEDYFEWHIQAMNFYDLVLTNGDTAQFWRELLE